MSRAKKPTVEPLIRVVGSDKEHAMEKMLSGDNPPELTSVGMVRVPGNNNWVSFVMTSKGSEVLRLEVGEPNLRGIAIDESKINCMDRVCHPNGLD